jgi:uncharacterized protein (TIGR02757 family)
MRTRKLSDEMRTFLDKKVFEYNRPSFIVDDPISIPHRYTLRQDIEIAGFFTAIFSWGNRTTIINKTRELMQLLDGAPYQFVLQHRETDLRRLLEFKHRTFNATDLLYFIAFLRHHYTHYDSLEDAFLRPWEDGSVAAAAGEPAAGAASSPANWRAERALSAFYHYFFSLDETPPRTRKHIASPEKHSSCKRINMFLRWMVRRDDNGVDFGLWRRIPMSALICPLDLHVARVAKKLKLLHRKPSDWQAATELTEQLRLLDPADPVKYDFALFGLGAMEKF